MVQFPALTIPHFADPRRASDEPNQWLRMQRIQLAWCVLCSVEIWVRQPLPPRKPYSKVLKARRHLRIRLEAKCIPPLGALQHGHRMSAKTIRSGGVRWQDLPPQTRAR